METDQERQKEEVHMSDTLLVVRYGGYGDHLFWSSLIPFWKERYQHIIVESNSKGHELFGHDPRISLASTWDTIHLPPTIQQAKCEERWDYLSTLAQDRGWDFVNLHGTAEDSCLYRDEVVAFSYSQDEREHSHHINLYEQVFKSVGIDMPPGWMHDNTIWFEQHEVDEVEAWRSKNPDMFLIYCVMAGSGQNKIFPTWLQQFCTNLIDTLPNAKIFLFGDQDCTQEVWQYERTISLVHGTTKYPLGFKQALLMTKYADFVFGPETGLLVGAGMMGTPKSMLFTLANKDQVVKHHRNDFSLQSQAGCSPCYTLAYSGLFCPKEDKYGLYPICTDSFDLRQLKRTIVRHYMEWEEYV